jgi:hypothetical protein
VTGRVRITGQYIAGGGLVASARELLRTQFEESSVHIQEVLSGIDDAEFFWEPVTGCWTVHRRADKRAKSADGSGEWVIDYEMPEPDPAPLTTIAWRTVHVAAVNYLYWDYAFGPATASFDLLMPGNANDAIAWLEKSQRPLAEQLSGYADDGRLDDLVLTNWGDRWPISRIFACLINEQVHHGAEISLLRGLYRNRDRLAN